METSDAQGCKVARNTEVQKLLEGAVIITISKYYKKVTPSVYKTVIYSK